MCDLLTARGLGIRPQNERVAKFDEHFDNPPQHVRESEQAVSDLVEQGISGISGTWVIFLIVGHPEVIVTAEKNRSWIAFPPCNMMCFDAAPVGLTAHGA